jgi:integrase
MKLLDLWQLFTTERRVAISESTYERVYAQIALWLSQNPYQELDQIRQAAVWQLQQPTLKNALRVVQYMKTMSQWACSEGVGLLPKNSLAGLKLPKPPQKDEITVIPTSCMDDVIHELRACSRHGNRWDLLSIFLLQTGLRPAEAFGMQWCDIDSEHQRLRVHQNMTISHGLVGRTKTGKERWVPLNKEAMKVLKKLGTGEPDAFVFPYNRHTYMWAFRAAMQRLVDRGVIPKRYRPYDLRHTHISKLLEKGIPVTQAATWSGNSAQVCWQHYAATTEHYQMPVL